MKGMYVTDGSRGNTITVPLTLSHQGGSNPLSSVTLNIKGISNDFVPASVNKAFPPDQRLKIFQETGKLPTGVIDLNSTVIFSQNNVTLKPNESATVYMIIHIPKNWADLTKSDINNLVYDIMKKYGSASGQES